MRSVQVGVANFFLGGVANFFLGQCLANFFLGQSVDTDETNTFQLKILSEMYWSRQNLSIDPKKNFCPL